MGNTPDPGWYHDPAESGRARYWDGERWTQHVRTIGVPPSLAQLEDIFSMPVAEARSLHPRAADAPDPYQADHTRLLWFALGAALVVGLVVLVALFV